MTPEDTVETRLWRTLVRVCSVEGEVVRVVLPSWGDEELSLQIKELPTFVQEALKPDFRLIAWANTGAHRVEDLRVTQWEPLRPNVPAWPSR